MIDQIESFMIILTDMDWGVVACPIPAPTKGSGYRQSDSCQIDPGFWLHCWIYFLVDSLNIHGNNNIG